LLADPVHRRTVTTMVLRVLVAASGIAALVTLAGRPIGVLCAVALVVGLVLRPLRRPPGAALGSAHQVQLVADALADRAGLRRPTVRLHDSAIAAYILDGSAGPVIVVNPSTIDLPLDQLQSIIAHELGHAARRDSLATVGGFAWMLAVTSAFGLAATSISQVAVTSPPLLSVVLSVAGMAVLCLGAAVGYLCLAALSRWTELSADRFAVELTGNPEGLMAGLRSVSEASPHQWPPLLERYASTHPTIERRLRSITHVAARRAR
jgi:Zn-dependent protease with chaperone function